MPAVTAPPAVASHKMRGLRLDRGPTEPAPALHLATLDGEIELRRTGIAAHDLDLEAEQLVHQQREIDQVGLGLVAPTTPVIRPSGRAQSPQP